MEENNIDYNSFNSLCLSGGSVKGLIMLGCVQYLLESGKLKNIKNFSGTSVGSIICYLICIGYQPIEILTSILVNKIIEKMQDMNIVSGLKKEGILDYGLINSYLENLTFLKVGKKVLMKDIKEVYGKNLCITTHNLTKNCREDITPETHPDMDCLDAIHMSCNIPILFGKFKYKDNYYIDGWFSENFPIQKLLESPENKVLGITIKYENNFDLDNTDYSIIDYIFNLVTTITNRTQNERIKNIEENYPNCKIHHIKNTINMFNFNLDTTKKLNLFSEGYIDMKNFLQ